MDGLISRETLSEDDLDVAIEHLAHIAPHWCGVYGLVRDQGLQLIFVEHERLARFWQNSRHRVGQPCLVYLADDIEKSLGPEGFHAASLRQLFRSCGAVFFNASFHDVEIYNTVGLAAMISHQPVILVECRQEKLDGWHTFTQRCGVDAARVVTFTVAYQPNGLSGVMLH